MKHVKIIAAGVTSLGRYEKGDIAIVSNEECELLKRIGCGVDYDPAAEAAAEAEAKKQAEEAKKAEEAKATEVEAVEAEVEEPETTEKTEKKPATKRAATAKKA